MDDLRIPVGILYIALGLFLPLLNMRFVYIFLSRKKYRNLECYRIMACIGIVQLFAGPGAIACGVIQLLSADPFKIFTFFVVLYSGSIVCEVFLNLILALNRLKVILQIRTPACIHKILLSLNAFYGIVYCAALLSPYCGYSIRPGHFVGSYDFSMPYTEMFAKLNSVFLLFISAITLISYLIITVNLLWMGAKSAPHVKKEKAIFVCALLRFAIEISMNISFFIVHLPPTPWAELLAGLTYFANSMLVSPVLYLSLTKSLREQFFAIFSRNKTGPIGTSDIGTSRVALRNDRF